MDAQGKRSATAKGRSVVDDYCSVRICSKLDSSPYLQGDSAAFVFNYFASACFAKGCPSSGGETEGSLRNR